MQEAFVTALIKELQPVFYVIGVFTIVAFVTFGSAIFKIIWELKKSREQNLKTSLDSIKSAIIDNTNQIIELKLRVGLFTEGTKKDINNLAKKIRSLETNA